MWAFFDDSRSLGEYFSQCKYTIRLNPENGARISKIILPSKAKNIIMDFEYAGLSFRYKKIQFQVIGFKYNTDKK